MIAQHIIEWYLGLKNVYQELIIRQRVYNIKWNKHDMKLYIKYALNYAKKNPQTFWRELCEKN